MRYTSSQTIDSLDGALVHMEKSKVLEKCIVKAESFIYQTSQNPSPLAIALSPFLINKPQAPYSSSPSSLLPLSSFSVSRAFPAPFQLHLAPTFPVLNCLPYGFCKSALRVAYPLCPIPSLPPSFYIIIMYPNLSRVVIPLTLERRQPHPQFQNQGYLPNGSSGPVPGAQALLPNNGRIIQSGATRVLCVADVRGMCESYRKEDRRD